MIAKYPEILKLDATGLPQDWIKVEDAISYYATDMVLFELGEKVVTFHGGYNRITNTQSEISTSSIIAVKGAFHKKNNFSTPRLTNQALFERDRYVCAYCGNVFRSDKLSRDHVHPKCQGGKDVWNNVVTACKTCNSLKGGRTVEQANLELLYTPYTPDLYENFILKRGTKRILDDQMEYLLHKVNKHSRMHELY